MVEQPYSPGLYPLLYRSTALPWLELPAQLWRQSRRAMPETVMAKPA